MPQAREKLDHWIWSGQAKMPLPSRSPWLRSEVKMMIASGTNQTTAMKVNTT